MSTDPDERTLYVEADGVPPRKIPVDDLRLVANALHRVQVEHASDAAVVLSRE